MKIIHLSDLHFGTETDTIVSSLERAIQSVGPDLVIVSGDFTQIGSEKEFEKAGAFLGRLPCRTLSVPGNHDVPATDLLERFTAPYRKYKKHIDKNLCPVFENDVVYVAGLNSARRALPHWNWANGAVSASQRELMAQRFCKEEPRWTICTLHHPLHKFADMPLDVTVFGGNKANNTIKDLKINLVLTGHVHYAALKLSGDENHQTVYLSASTALSSRTRGQENGFNIITLDEATMKIDIYKLEHENFTKVQNFEIKKAAPVL